MTKFLFFCDDNVDFLDKIEQGSKSEQEISSSSDDSNDNNDYYTGKTKITK